MSTIIKNTTTWFNDHPKAKQWAWFFALWCGGFLAVVALSTPIKWLIKSIG